ncbi:MAG: ABC transporter ATP-binding protein [Candidatus Eisenbacteria bacterium]|nr:ABC transporter ATP-binding protein [Candidatus Eisenbacteria bacterium]
MDPNRRLLAYLKPEWRTLALGLVCMAGYALLSGFSIGMIYPVIDGLFAAEPQTPVTAPVVSGLDIPDRIATVFAEALGHLKALHLDEARVSFLSGLRSILADSPRRQILAVICFSAIILILLRNSFDYLRKILFTRLEQRATEAIRNDLYARVIHLPLSAFDRNHSGGLISRVINDVEAIKSFTVAGLTQVLHNSLLVFVYLGITFAVDARLAMTTLVILPPLMFFLGRLAVRLKKHSGRAQQRLADLQEHLQETVQSVRVVKAFAQEDTERERFRRATDRYRRTVTRLLSIDLLAAPLSEFWAVSVGVVVLWYGGLAVLDPQSGLTAGRFFLFLFAMFSLMHPLKEVSGALGKIQRGRVSATRVFELMDMPSEPLDDIGTPIESFHGSIRFRGVGFSYDGATPVLAGIDFEVRAGQTVAIVGPSGAGKTTLVDMIPRFYEPTSGVIEIDGRDTRSVKLKDLRRLMGIVTQETILFDDTVAANIAYGSPAASREEVEAAAQAANAHDFIVAMPRGYDASIGESGQLLSGGQRQRLAIARAILRNPPILIFDEATSSLDTESEALVQEAIERLLADRTTFVIAHRLSTVTRADRILVVSSGRVTEDGTHEELIATGGIYSRLYRRQFRDEEPAPELAPAGETT